MLLLAGAGCRVDTTGQGSGAPPISQKDLAEVAARTVCEWLYQCECDVQGMYSSQAQCESALEAFFQGAIDEGVDAGLDYDPECGGERVALLEELGCARAGSLDASEFVDLLATLQCKLFYGDVAPGDPCTSLQQSRGDTCERTAECVAGTCEEMPQYPGPGDACEENEPCTDGAVCVMLEADGERTCERLPEAGELCLGASDQCATDFTCDQQSKECEPAPEVGEQCAATPSQCGPDLYCHPSALCTALPPAGEPCAMTMAGPMCASEARCEAGMCVAEDPFTCSVGSGILSIGGS